MCLKRFCVAEDDDRDFLSNEKTRVHVLPYKRLLWEHITRPSTEVALVHIGLELVAKIDRLGGVLVFQKESEVLDNRVCVVVRLQEPVCFILDRGSWSSSLTVKNIQFPPPCGDDRHIGKPAEFLPRDCCDPQEHPEQRFPAPGQGGEDGDNEENGFVWS